VFVISDDAAGVSEFETFTALGLVDGPEVIGSANTGFSYAQL
jgi:hypothetical protein